MSKHAVAKQALAVPKTVTRKKKRSPRPDEEENPLQAEEQTEAPSKTTTTTTTWDASHAVALKKIKRRLGIENKIEKDALLALGRCLDDARAVIIGRFLHMEGQVSLSASRTTLTQQTALTAIFETVSDPDHHRQLVSYVHDALDAYSGVATAPEGGNALPRSVAASRVDLDRE